jgi:hypothetical protein
VKVKEIADPQGGRNRIRSGDAVKIRRGVADSSGFKAVFIEALVDAAGTVIEVVVYGGRGYDPAKGPLNNGGAICQFRTVLPDRVCRMSQSHVKRRGA